MIALLGQLFITFFVIGLINFGGGAAMLSLIQAQVVTAHAWITEATFTDIVAISQTTPGPIGINCATYVGYEVMHNAGYGAALSIFGSAATTLAIVLPSFIIFFIVIRVFNKYNQSPIFADTMTALRPAVAGLIATAALILIVHTSWNGLILQMQVISENFPDWKSWVLFAIAFAVSYFKKVNPILIIIASGIIGLLIY